MSSENSSQLAIVTTYAGRAVRYSFYLAGTFFFAVIAITAVQVSNRFSESATKQAFQIAAPELARLSFTGSAVKFYAGWQETLEFGKTYDRDTDFTLILQMPSDPNQPQVRAYARQMSDLRPLAHTTYSGSTAYYDLETRFGPVRAANFQINADGQTKLCVSYLSRFETSTVFYKGWFCEASGARPNFTKLACILDRLTLKGQLPSAPAQAFLEERIRRPARCSASPVSQTTDTRPARPMRRF